MDARKLERSVFPLVRLSSAAKRQGESKVFRKSVLCVALLGIVALVSLTIPPQRVESAQSIRLPFPPLYYSDLSQSRVPITDACRGGSPGHVEHRGSAEFAVDFGLTSGIPVYAPVSGTVIHAQEDTTGYGLLIKISEDGVGREHWLAHLSLFYVTAGHVDRGNLIALSGDTGNGPAHLHYHVQTSGGAAVDVRGELPNISWVDSTDYCNEGGQIDGTAHASPITRSFGESAQNCADFFNLGFGGVWGFDAPHCQGNILFSSLEAGETLDGTPGFFS